MTIKDITEIANPNNINLKPIKEVQDIYVPNIVNQNISGRNGMVYCLTGSGGSGKTSLLLNMFKSKLMYRNRFNNTYYIYPSSSFSLSVHDQRHPFEKHDKVHHELTVGSSLSDNIYNELIAKKEAYTVQYQEEKKQER